MLDARRTDMTAKVVLYVASSLSIVIVALIFLFLGKEALPFVEAHGLSWFSESRWLPVSFAQPRFGILPLLNGTVLVTGIAMLTALPFGVCGAGLSGRGCWST